MTVALVFIAIVYALFLLFAYCLCCVASEADDDAGR